MPRPPPRFKTPRFPGERLMPRKVPYIPFLKERRQLHRVDKIRQFEAMHADGTVFLPEPRLPPWKRREIVQAEQQSDHHHTNSSTNTNQRHAALRRLPRYNFCGFRVRVLPQTEDGGFPTHFR